MLPALFEILLGHLTNRQVSYLSQIMEAIFAMTGAVSMLSISRINGIPYRTVQRFYAQVYDWDAIRFGLYDNFVSLPSEGTVKWFKKTGHIFKIVRNFCIVFQHFFSEKPSKRRGFFEKITQFNFLRFSKIVPRILLGSNNQSRSVFV